jgi:two-component system cell cycle response regulator
MTHARILFVDDQRSIRYHYEAMLRKEGFEVEAVGDAESALERLTPGHGFHLVISDLMMPGIDGLGLVARLREMPHNGLLPVLMLTGSTDRSDVVSSLKAGANDYVAKDGDPFEFLARVQSHSRTGILQEKLDRASRTDELTQLFNRRHGTQRLDEEIARSERYGRGLAVCLMDIDHFKKVNDSHGHQAGDEVLVEVARRLSDASRDSDCVIRWGGEEFLVLFPETDIGEAASIVERFRSELGGAPVTVLGEGAQLEITVSGGVSELESGDTPELLVARADSALYKAKETGRNRLLLAQSGELMPIKI